MDTEHLSGDYAGYYAYSITSSEYYEMKTSFIFDESGGITGFGQDNVNAFTFNGRIDLESKSVKLSKTYPTHTVEYNGTLSLEHNLITISGTWDIKSGFKTSGVFTLRKGKSNQEAVMADIDAIEAKLKKEMEAIAELEIKLV